MASRTGSDGQHDTVNPPTGPSGPVPKTLTDMPRAGWLAILKRSIREFKHDDITDRAAALTYFGVLALFPAMLVLVSILGLLGKSTTQQVLSNIGQIAPGGVHTFLQGVVTQVQGKAGVAGVAGIIGIVVALWSASGYVAAFMRASNAIYDVDEGRPIWKTAPVRVAHHDRARRHARDRGRDRGPDRAGREPGRHGLRHRPRRRADLGHRRNGRCW